MQTNDIRIAVLIPTRNERPAFLKQCFKMMDSQTLKPNYIHLVDYEPLSNDKDITQRYKRGYQLLTRMNSYDLIAFIEEDDYYAPDYFETMITEWITVDQPDLFGTGSTIYYHLKLNKYFTFNHPRRSSAMNMFIRPGINLHWCEDNYAFTDMHLWNMTDIAQQHLPEASRLPKNIWLRGHIFQPEKIVSIGIKHGVGLCGGRNHVDRLERYDNDDSNLDFLRANCDDVSFEFYANMFK